LLDIAPDAENGFIQVSAASNYRGSDYIREDVLDRIADSHAILQLDYCENNCSLAKHYFMDGKTGEVYWSSVP